MVDREARNKIAERLRHFASGQITNQELCDYELKSKDNTANNLDAIIQTSFEGIYSKPYRLRGKYAPSREERRYMARMILFLQTDYHYEYEAGPASWLRCLVPFLALCLLCWISSYQLCLSMVIKLLLAASILFITIKLVDHLLDKRKQENGGDESVWPFFRRSDYEEALKHPKFLCGR